MTNTTYKQTAIGLIPSDWEVKKLGEIGRIVTGNTPSRNDLTLWDGDFCWASAKDFKGKYIYNTFEKITKKGCDGARLLPKGAILITCIASIGNNAIAAVPLATNQQINSIIVSDKFDNEWLYYQLVFFRQNLELLASKTSIPLINKSDFSSFKIPIPPLPEQQKIASILSTWDTAIDNCKSIIDELKDRNKGLAQQLLTGKMRVKGFEGSKWKTLKLGKLGSIISGLTYSPDDINENEGVLVLRSSNIQDKKIDMKSTVYVKIKNGQFNAVLKDDILICVRNGSRNLIGKNLLIPKELEGVAFGAFMSVFRSEFNSYLIHLFDSQYYYKEIEKNLGATINSINGSDLKNFKFPFPALDEQKAIATILDKATEELNQYQQKLETLQLQKKGLMQQLLTGKVRVKI